MSDTDFRLLHEKLDRFEQKLKELEAEIKAEIKALKPILYSVRFDVTKERKDEQSI